MDADKSGKEPPNPHVLPGDPAQRIEPDAAFAAIFGACRAVARRWIEPFMVQLGVLDPPSLCALDTA